MDNIFEKLDRISALLEAEEKSEETVKKIKPIPVNPEMETEEQGINKADEKLAKYFYNLNMDGGGGGDIEEDDDMDIPDDLISPILKGKMKGKMKDKKFTKNKVLWDKEDLEKLKKEVEVDMSGDSEDDFDDFDYKDNEFGDEDTSDLETDNNDESGSGSSSDEDKSEKDKLKDAINDAINKMKDNKQQSGGDSGSQSGSESGSESSSSPSGQSGSESGGKSSGESGEQEDSSSSGSAAGKSGSDSGKSMSAKDKRLSELQNALDKDDAGAAGSAFDELKEGESGTGKLAGENSENVSDDAFRNDMKSAGFSDEEIDEMTKIKDDNTTDEESKKELDDIKRKIVDGLEKKCKKRGGSALAKTVVKNSLRSKVDNEEWKEMLKMFLKMKSIYKGDTTKAKNRTMWGNKNHLWRGAVLPTRTTGKGEIQKIYCFVDFSGSVNQDLVYTFLGRVIDLCQELSYTDVVVYGFGDRIVLPRKINGKMLKHDGKEVVLSQTWDYINSQDPGPGSENFEDVSLEINEIRKHDRNPVFLIFGDAFWSAYGNSHPPMFLKMNCGDKVLDDICMLTYYLSSNGEYAGEIAYLKELVGIKHIITTKATSIRGE